jgi:predicted transcriptional regulator
VKEHEWRHGAIDLRVDETGDILVRLEKLDRFRSVLSSSSTIVAKAISDELLRLAAENAELRAGVRRRQIELLVTFIDAGYQAVCAEEADAEVTKAVEAKLRELRAEEGA